MIIKIWIDKRNIRVKCVLLLCRLEQQVDAANTFQRHEKQ